MNTKRPFYLRPHRYSSPYVLITWYLVRNSQFTITSHQYGRKYKDILDAITKTKRFLYFRPDWYVTPNFLLPGTSVDDNMRTL